MGHFSNRITGLIALVCAVIVFACAFPAFADESSASSDITRRCIFEVSEGTKSFLTDGEVRRAWEYEGDSAQIDITLPSDIKAGYIFIYWLFDDESYDISEYTSDGRLLRTRNQDATFHSIANCLPLLPETKKIKLTPNVAGQEICEIRIYTEGELPANVMVWDPPLEKCDLMVVSAHQDDELIFFGGAIPYYAIAEGHPTQVVYMANCTRLRRQEALHGLWVMGMKNYPEFINLRDHNSDSMDEALQLWNGRETAIEVLVERIRRFKPEVILTHDLNGEYGHFQHQITARVMKDAIEAAADESQYTASAEKYGAWQVKKLYLHLYDENVIQMDWNTPLEALGGKSPLEVARLGYAQHESQQEFYQVNDGGKYDNAKFGLYYTTVGLDTGKNDFFENIDEASLQLSRVTSQPAFIPAGESATEAPTEEATELPTYGADEGTTQATAVPEATDQIIVIDNTQTQSGGLSRGVIGAILAVAGIAGAGLAVNNLILHRNGGAGSARPSRNTDATGKSGAAQRNANNATATNNASINRTSTESMRRSNVISAATRTNPSSERVVNTESRGSSSGRHSTGNPAPDGSNISEYVPRSMRRDNRSDPQ